MSSIFVPTQPRVGRGERSDFDREVMESDGLDPSRGLFPRGTSPLFLPSISILQRKGAVSDRSLVYNNGAASQEN
jgi:hypothetical protein